MGKLSKTLEEFSKISEDYYKKIQDILEDEYCWKCPMRTTSKKASCKNIDAWIRLTSAFEIGINQYQVLNKDSKNSLEAITSRYLSKLIKKHERNLKYKKTFILKLKEDIKPFAKKNDLLLVKENPESVKVGDLVLWPQICPISIYWFSKAKLAGYIPFNILKVSNTFHMDGCRYVQDDKGFEVPLEYIAGKIIRKIDQNDEIYLKLNL